MERDEESMKEQVRRALLTTNYMEQVSSIKRDGMLNPGQLACAMYEGMPHVQNLAETLARTHGTAGALTFFDMMGEDVQNFWIAIAAMLIKHARCWKGNEGSACVLDPKEQKRLAELPRVNPDDESTWPTGFDLKAVGDKALFEEVARRSVFVKIP